MGELRPCPFCGGEAQYSVLGPIGDSVQCSHCLVAPRILHREHEAITAWNARPTEDDLVAALECMVDCGTLSSGEFLKKWSFSGLTEPYRRANATLAKHRSQG